MQIKKFIGILFLFINAFIPGSANIKSNSPKLGTLLIFTSILLYFFLPYLPLNLVRISYLLLLVISYASLLRKTKADTKKRIPKNIVLVAILFFLFSLLSFNLTHRILSANSSNYNNEIVYILGTRPFKIDSANRMLEMEEDKLFELFKEDVHPFFRRLKVGIKKIGGSGEHHLIISAGKNQKQIVNKILNQANVTAEFLSCKNTIEEVKILKRHIENNNLGNLNIIMVSDDYHAFRTLLYSKLFNLRNVKFLATSYDYSFISYVKIYLVEQTLYLFSYLSLPLSLMGIIL